jgi:hypothetical protein
MEPFCTTDRWGPNNVSNPSWSSDNLSVATVSGQTINAVGVGTAHISAAWSVTAAYGHSCAPIPGGGGAMATLNVDPTVTSVVPGRGVKGGTTQVTIAGSGFVSVDSINAGAHVAVSGITVVNPNSITANFTPDSSDPGGSRGVTVTVNGRPSNAGSFYVQIPTHLTPLTTTVTYNDPNNNPITTTYTSGIGPLITLSPPNGGSVISVYGHVFSSGQNGVYRNYIFMLTDQDNPAQEITYRPFDFTETFSNYSGSNSIPPSQTGTVPSDKEPIDNQSSTVNVPFLLQPGETDTFDQAFSVKIGTNTFPLTTVIHVSKGNFAGTLKVDRTITTP